MLRPESSWGFGALLKGLTSVVDNSSWSRDSNPQPRITSPTLYPLGHNCTQMLDEFVRCVFFEQTTLCFFFIFTFTISISASFYL